MMMTQLVKLTVLPCESVILPSSNSCSKMLKTSWCAFSISSKRTTE
uniref:Chaperone clpb, putative n=1 Tax=Arundo donax TaxID=35708 RepID=A0A0A9F7T0_ARUDO